MSVREPAKRRTGKPARERILETTVDLLKERGTAAVTTDAIAEQAGVSKASIYRRWHTKSELVVAAIEEVIRPVTIPDLGSFAAELRYLLDIRLQQWADPSNALVLQAFIGAAAGDDIMRRSFEAWTATQRQGARAMVERGIERGDVAGGWNPDNVVTMLAAPTMFRAIIEEAPPDQTLVDDVVAVITAAVERPPVRNEAADHRA